MMSQEPFWLSMPDNQSTGDVATLSDSMYNSDETTSGMQNTADTDAIIDGEPIVSSGSLEFVSYHNLEPDQQFAFVSYSIFAGICSITFWVLLYITIKVIKKVGSTDKIIPTMLIML